MSLRIKLPALNPPPSSPTPVVMEDFQWSEQPKRRRKRPRRYVGSDDDEVDLAAETSVVDNPRPQDSLIGNLDIDVVGEEEHEHNDQRSEPSKPSIRGQNGKGKATATTSAKGGAKRKKMDNTSEAQTTSRKKSKLTPNSDEVPIDVVGDGPSAPNVSILGDRSIHTISKHDSPPPSASTPQQPPPKKQKLPTIKKVKLSNFNTPTSTVVKDTVVLPLGSKPVQDGVRKTLTGATDIDLSNKSIYEEIFSKSGQGDGGAPRAGSNRRTKEEERRKELNRQRNEAKAKWALGAWPTFDLQAQFDKISRFEEKLKAKHSSALYPNFLAGKWREDWEKEKRRQKGKVWHDPIYSHESTSREEGEVR